MMIEGYIADTEKANFALTVQCIERFGYLLRFKQQIRTVQKQHVQVIRLQPLQAFFGTGQDILPAPVKFLPVEMQAAFALNEDFFPAQPGQGKRLAEARFRFSVPIAGGVIEKLIPSSAAARTMPAASRTESAGIRMHPRMTAEAFWGPWAMLMVFMSITPFCQASLKSRRRGSGNADIIYIEVHSKSIILDFDILRTVRKSFRPGSMVFDHLVI